MIVNLKGKKELLNLLVRDFLDNSKNKDIIDKYNKFVSDVVREYNNNISLSNLSYKYDIGELSQKLKAEAKEIGNYPGFAEIVVNKMLNHDEFALNFYTFLYEETNPEIVLSNGAIYSDENLFKAYKEHGGGIDAICEMNAELWIQSPIGETYLENSLEDGKSFS
ncbi:MAG: hypothetical protein N4A31_03335 [Rickettsiales bacterium]|jgi:hypothetical protein|nr:hypothetical protein [Rickettsiales bacterium]